VSAKYAVIAAHRTQYPIRLMCRVLAVSPAGFYAAQQRPPSARAHRDEAVLVNVRHAFHHAPRRTYGAPRVHQALRQAGVRVGKKRVARLMRADQLVAARPTRWVATTDSRHADPIVPNHLARDFAPGPAVNTVWMSDVTYVPTQEGWRFLALVLDRASRPVIGWAMSATNDTRLVTTALQRALAWRQPPMGVLHHSDRGSTYASAAYQAVLTAHGLVPSMSRAGDCWDNAVVESFFSTLEFECFAGQPLLSAAATERAVATYIEEWYNRERLHSSLGYRSPLQYESDLRRITHAA
jgi:putative transposase